MASHMVAAMTDEEKKELEDEYQSLLALYISMLQNFNLKIDREEALYKLAALRTQIAFNHVLKGLGVDFDYAIRLIQNTDDNNLTQYDKEMSKRLIAALTNLIDFSICAEYQLYEETFEEIGVSEDNEDDDKIDWVLLGGIEDYEDLELLCEKYNRTYATVEHSDIEYAGKMAAFWIALSEAEYIMYLTQNDAKVRPSHMALHGYTVPKSDFPSWMIPPIDYNCRCYLERFDIGSMVGLHPKVLPKIHASSRGIQKPTGISEVFNESLATCGRIFGPAHNYFTVKEKHREMLSGFVKRLKAEYGVE